MVKTFSLNFAAKMFNTFSENEFPQAIFSDISDLDFQKIKNKEIDVVIGGPPCQDFSVLRSSSTERSGINVKRGRLYGHFVRALVNLQPKAFIFENVPGLLSANCGVAYGTIIRDFTDLNLKWSEIKEITKTEDFKKTIKGYKIIFNQVVTASDFGVPQARRRLIIVGLRKDIIGNTPDLLLSSQFKKDLYGDSLFHKYPLTTIETFEGEIISNLQNKYEDLMSDYKGIWEVSTPRSIVWKNKIWDKLTFDILKDYLTANKNIRYDQEELEKALFQHKEILKELDFYKKRIQDIKFEDGSDLPTIEDKEVISKMHKIPPGENFNFTAGSAWELRSKGVSQIHRRLHPLRPSYTVVAFGGGGMAMYHYKRNRSALLTREKARLQTFPDSFKFTGSYSTMKAEIGEAVPPLLARRFATALYKILKYIE